MQVLRRRPRVATPLRIVEQTGQALSQPTPTTLSSAAGRALGLGVVTGLRSVSGPAIFSYAASRGGTAAPKGKPFAFLAGRKTSNVLALLAAGEMSTDKLPFVPSRTKPAGLFSRAQSGAFVGGAAFRAAEKPVWAGMALGGLGALLGSFAGYQARTMLVRTSGLPDPLIALGEDALTVSSGYLSVRYPIYGLALAATGAGVLVALRTRS